MCSRQKMTAKKHDQQNLHSNEELAPLVQEHQSDAIHRYSHQLNQIQRCVDVSLIDIYAVCINCQLIVVFDGNE